MKIINMRKVPPKGQSRVRASFDIEFNHIIVYGCLLLENHKGELFAKMPFKEYTQNGIKKFIPLVSFKETRFIEVISNIARDMYDHGLKEMSAAL